MASMGLCLSDRLGWNRGCGKYQGRDPRPGVVSNARGVTRDQGSSQAGVSSNLPAVKISDRNRSRKTQILTRKRRVTCTWYIVNRFQTYPVF